MKTGKLAVGATFNKRYKNRLMLLIARGFLQKIKEQGIGCNFIMWADLDSSNTITEFYQKNAFVLNEKSRKNAKTVSMRMHVCDIPATNMGLE
jgi:hypothetical protein